MRAVPDPGRALPVAGPGAAQRVELGIGEDGGVVCEGGGELAVDEVVVEEGNAVGADAGDFAGKETSGVPGDETMANQRGTQLLVG